MTTATLFLSSLEAAALLRISQLTMQRLASAGALPVYKYAKNLRFRRDDVLRFAEYHRVEPRRPDLYAGPQD